MMKVSVSSYSYSQAFESGRMTLKDAIQTTKDLGLDAFEVVDFNFKKFLPEGKTKEEYADEIRSECERCGLPVSNYTVGADFLNRETAEEVDRVKKEVDIAVILGAKSLRHDAAWGANGKFISFDHALPKITEGIRQVTEYAAEKGVRTMSENHGFYAQDALRVERMINMVNNPNYGWLVDMGNFTCADEDPARSVGIAAPYAFYVHAKDFIIKPAEGPDPGRYFFQSRGGNYLRGTIVGQGMVPVKQCLMILQKAGYNGYVSIEFEGMEDCVKAIEAGAENLRRYIAEIGADKE